jgi:hypothetical protein
MPTYIFLLEKARTNVPQRTTHAIAQFQLPRKDPGGVMSRMRRNAYAVARWGFCLASIAYLLTFAHRTMSSGGRLALLQIDAWWRICVGALIFSSTAWLMAIGWQRLLQNLSYASSLWAAARILCITQIAKYLPGNVGHHVGRVGLAKTRLHVPSTIASISIMQEGAMLTLAALLAGFAGYGLRPALQLPGITAGVDSRILLLFALVVGLGSLTAINALRTRHAGSKAAWTWMFHATPSWAAVRASLPPYLLVYLVNGIAVSAVASASLQIHFQDAILLTSAYALAWVVGFLVPGAPGGLGVRETALVMLLGNAYSAPMILTISLSSRVATILADAIIFAVGLAMSRSKSRPLQ